MKFQSSQATDSDMSNSALSPNSEAQRLDTMLAGEYVAVYR